MKDPVTIPREEYECLRRCLNEAIEIFQGLGVREQEVAPKLSPQQQRMNKYRRLLDKKNKK